MSSIRLSCSDYDELEAEETEEEEDDFDERYSMWGLEEEEKDREQEQNERHFLEAQQKLTKEREAEKKEEKKDVKCPYARVVGTVVQAPVKHFSPKQLEPKGLVVQIVPPAVETEEDAVHFLQLQLARVGSYISNSYSCIRSISEVENAISHAENLLRRLNTAATICKEKVINNKLDVGKIDFSKKLAPGRPTGFPTPSDKVQSLIVADKGATLRDMLKVMKLSDSIDTERAKSLGSHVLSRLKEQVRIKIPVRRGHESFNVMVYNSSELGMLEQLIIDWTKYC